MWRDESFVASNLCDQVQEGARVSYAQDILAGPQTRASFVFGVFFSQQDPGLPAAVCQQTVRAQLPQSVLPPASAEVPLLPESPPIPPGPPLLDRPRQRLLFLNFMTDFCTPIENFLRQPDCKVNATSVRALFDSLGGWSSLRQQLAPRAKTKTLHFIRHAESELNAWKTESA
jgi:hypothetical protein